MSTPTAPSLILRRLGFRWKDDHFFWKGSWLDCALLLIIDDPSSSSCCWRYLRKGNLKPSHWALFFLKFLFNSMRVVALKEYGKESRLNLWAELESLSQFKMNDQPGKSSRVIESSLSCHNSSNNEREIWKLCWPDRPEFLCISFKRTYKLTVRINEVFPFRVATFLPNLWKTFKLKGKPA